MRSPERGNAARARIVATLVAEGGHGTEAEIGERVVVLKGDLQDLDDVARCARAFWWVCWVGCLGLNMWVGGGGSIFSI